MKKVLIPTKLDGIVKKLLEKSGLYEVLQDDATSIEDLAKLHSDAYAIIVRSEKITDAIMDKFPNLKVIVRAGAGFNTIDIKYARKRKIDVMNTPGANSNAVAEEVIAMILADIRHIVEADASTRRGEWEKKKFMGRELAGKTVGIVGLGNIGRVLAKRLSGFEVRILGYDPVILSERAASWGVELTSLKTLFAEADFISLHVPENEETRKMINAELLLLMKEGGTLINCARSGVIDEQALREVRKSKNIRFLNDVYPKDEAGRKSVEDICDIMLPHLGASTKEANLMAARRAAEELIDFDTKGVTSFIVNRDIPEGLDEAYCSLANCITKLARSIGGKDKSLKLIETSFYGDLEKYGDWLLVPILSGIWDDYDRARDARAAREYMEEMGVEYVNRKTDNTKGYGDSITIDLTSEVEKGSLRRVSIRGTVTENTLTVSRINQFNKLYFEPTGNIVCFIYDDKPGVIGIIGATLASESINIEDMRHAHDAKSKKSMVILELNVLPAKTLIDKISNEIKAITACGLTI